MRMFLYFLSLLATQKKSFDVGRIEENNIDLSQYLCDIQIEDCTKYQLATHDISDIEAEMKKIFQEELEKRNLVCEKQEDGFWFKITIEEDYDPVKTYNHLQDRFVANINGMSRLQVISCNTYKEKYLKICSDLVSAINVLHCYCKNEREKLNSDEEETVENTLYKEELSNSMVMAINFFLYCQKDISTSGILLHPTAIIVSMTGEFELRLFYEDKIIEDVDFSSFGDLKDFIVKRIDDNKYNDKNEIDNYIKSKTKQQSDVFELRKNIKKAYDLIQKFINAERKFSCAHLKHFSCNQTDVKLYDITEEDKKNLAALGITDRVCIEALGTTVQFNNETVDHVILPNIDYLERYKTLCTNYAELYFFCHQILTIFTYLKTAAYYIIECKTMDEYLQTDIVNAYKDNTLITVIEEYKDDAKEVITEIQEKINTNIKEYNEKTVVYEDFYKEPKIIQKLEFKQLDRAYNATKHVLNNHTALENRIEISEIQKKQQLEKMDKIFKILLDKMQEISNGCTQLINEHNYEDAMKQYNKLMNENARFNPNKDLDYNTKDRIRTPVKYFTDDYNILVNNIDEMKEVAMKAMELLLVY